MLFGSNWQQLDGGYVIVEKNAIISSSVHM